MDYRGRHYPDDLPDEDPFEDRLRIDAGGVTPSEPEDRDPLPGEPPPRHGKPIGPMDMPPRPLVAEELDHDATALTGDYDAWAGRVRKVFYGDATGSMTGNEQEIQVERCSCEWGTNNDPSPYEIPMAASQPSSAYIAALPFPVRHDQVAYHVAVGDIVTVLTGRDGRAWFMSDELPFIGQVIMRAVTAADGAATAPPGSPNDGDIYIVNGVGTGAFAGHNNDIATYTAATTSWSFTDAQIFDRATVGATNYIFSGTTWGTSTYASASESNTGGAGILCLCVRRQALTGDPAGATFYGATRAALQDADSVNIDYDQVLVISPTNTAHGFRTGDYVVVERRGRYYFARPVRECFPAITTDAGPDGEDDYVTNHYWVKEEEHPVVYGAANAWTATPAVRSATDPSGSGGRFGRWVDAQNIAEPANGHWLPVGTRVLVYVVQHVTTGAHGYLFRALPWPCVEATYDPLATDNNYLYDANARAAPTADDITGDPSDGDHSWASGFMYRDANGKMNPWVVLDLTNYPTDSDIAGYFCYHATHDPLKTGGKTLPPGVDITGSVAGSDDWATGHMYVDAAGNLNPWICLDLSDYVDTGSFAASFCFHATYDPLGAGAKEVPAGTDVTGDPSNPYGNWVTGHMYYDASGKLNPWFSIDLGYSLPQGESIGDMLYWDGTKWVLLAAPVTGDFVLMSSGAAPYWTEVEEFACP